MSAPLTFCKGGKQFTACSQHRGTFVSIGLLGGCIAMILDHQESDELEAMLAAARLNRQPSQRSQAA